MSSSPYPAAVTERAVTSVLELIGHTPLIRLQQFERETPGVELYAKAEWHNPGGSVKDRAAARMILEGEKSGRMAPGLTLGRRHLGQYGHRVLDDRGRQGLQGEALSSRERQP